MDVFAESSRAPQCCVFHSQSQSRTSKVEKCYLIDENEDLRFQAGVPSLFSTFKLRKCLMVHHSGVSFCCGICETTR